VETIPVSRPRRFLVTFATPGFKESLDRLVGSAHCSGQFEDIYIWNETLLRSDPLFRGEALIAYDRGIGFWSWKPHIILAALNDARDGDVVVYSDAGRYRGGYTVYRSVAPLIAFAELNAGCLPGVLIPNYGPNSHWTRRDCFVLMKCDSVHYWSHPQVQATFSVWIKNEQSLQFLREWRAYCMDIRIIGDGPNTCGLPNLPGFVDHRHDQSVLTNLVLMRRITPLVIKSRLFRCLVALKPRALSASLVHKKIDNISAIAAGTHPLRPLAQEVLGSTTVGRYAYRRSEKDARR
jgi:hypothetical protein